MVSEFLSGMTRTYPPNLTQWADRSSIKQFIDEVNYQFSRRISYVASTGKETHARCEDSVVGSCAEPMVRIRDLLTKPAGKGAESTLTEPTGVG
jgi:hypothetical protein